MASTFVLSLTMYYSLQVCDSTSCLLLRATNAILVFRECHRLFLIYCKENLSSIECWIPSVLSHPGEFLKHVRIISTSTFFSLSIRDHVGLENSLAFMSTVFFPLPWISFWFQDVDLS